VTTRCTSHATVDRLAGQEACRSIISPDVRVNSYALVEDSILLDGVEVGRRARIRRAIIDKEVKIPPGFEIGWNRELDRARPDHHPRRPHRRRQGRRARAVCVNSVFLNALRLRFRLVSAAPAMA